MTYWFPSALRARLIAGFLAGVPLAGAVGAPLSSMLMEMDGIYGLHGWQWMFLIEGLPSVLLGIVALGVLPDRPANAKFLNAEEKALIEARLIQEPKPDHHSLKDMFSDARVWLLAIPDFGIVIALYGVGLWLPQMVKAVGFSNMQTGFVTAVPYSMAVIAMILWGWSSDRSGERLVHIAGASCVAAIALIVASFFPPGMVTLIALTIASMGIYAALATFWTLPTMFLGGTAAAGGIALINALANTGGFFGPYLVGWLKGNTGGYESGMFALGLMLIMTTVLIPLLGRLVKQTALAK